MAETHMMLGSRVEIIKRKTKNSEEVSNTGTVPFWSITHCVDFRWFITQPMMSLMGHSKSTFIWMVSC